MEYVLHHGICSSPWNMFFTMEYVLHHGICSSPWNMFPTVELLVRQVKFNHQLRSVQRSTQLSQHAHDCDLTDSCCVPLCWWWWRVGSSCSSSSRQTLAGVSRSDWAFSSVSPVVWQVTRVNTELYTYWTIFDSLHSLLQTVILGSQVDSTQHSEATSA